MSYPIKPPKSLEEAKARIQAAQGARERHVQVMDALLSPGRFEDLQQNDPDSVLPEVRAYIARGEPYQDVLETDAPLYRALSKRIAGLIASGAVKAPESFEGNGDRMIYSQ